MPLYAFRELVHGNTSKLYGLYLALRETLSQLLVDGLGEAATNRPWWTKTTCF